MSASLDDRELLRRYAGEGSEEAFRELVNRHIHHVYSIALREVQEPHTASDITQAAFIILARKASRIGDSSSLSAWLFQTVRYAASNARRAAWRRKRHEEEAAAMIPNNSGPETEALWSELAPLLNDALASLTASDRDVVTLRFFEKQSHEEIGARLNLPESVARKRLSRALERLRLFFARRGVTVTAASLLAVLGTHSVSAAPAGLAGVVTASAVAKGAAVSASVAALAHGASQAAAWAKVKTAAAVAGLATLFCTGVVLSDTSRFRIDEVQFTTRFQSLRFTDTPSTADGTTNLFVLTSQRRRWGIGGDLAERFLRLFPQARVHRLEVVDDRGDSFAGRFEHSTLFDAKGAKYQLWQLPLVPRRGTNLFLRFFELSDDGRERHVARFELRNPARGSYSAYTAETLPSTKSAGDVTVTLDRLEAGSFQGDPGAPSLATHGGRPQTCLTVGLHQPGLSRPPWTLGSVQVADATGNRWRTRELTIRSLPGEDLRFEAAFDGALWPGEPAWQFDLELIRTNDFAATDVLTISDLKVPAAHEVVELNQTHPLAGGSLRLLSIRGSQAYPPERGYVSVSLDAQGHSIETRRGLPPGGYLKLEVEAKGAGAGQRITLLATTDERGRPVQFEAGASTRKTQLNYLLEAGPEARSLTLRFARQESRSVSFVARPVQTGSNTRR